MNSSQSAVGLHWPRGFVLSHTCVPFDTQRRLVDKSLTHLLTNTRLVRRTHAFSRFIFFLVRSLFSSNHLPSVWNGCYMWKYHRTRCRVYCDIEWNWNQNSVLKYRWKYQGCRDYVPQSLWCYRTWSGLLSLAIAPLRRTNATRFSRVRFLSAAIMFVRSAECQVSWKMSRVNTPPSAWAASGRETLSSERSRVSLGPAWAMPAVSRSFQNTETCSETFFFFVILRAIAILSLCYKMLDSSQ